MSTKKLKCPCCDKRVAETHFACKASSIGGKSGRGEAKKRSPEHYARIVQLATEARQRKARERMEAKNE